MLVGQNHGTPAMPRIAASYFIPNKKDGYCIDL